MAWTAWAPGKAAHKKGLAFNGVVMALAPDPGNVESLFMMRGWVGPAVEPEVYRVYQSYALDDYYEVAEADVVFSVPEERMVWIRRGATMRHVVARERDAEVDYLEGGIAAQAEGQIGPAASGGLGGPEPTKCPPCPSR
jgi:hypothetical protein